MATVESLKTLARSSAAVDAAEEAVARLLEDAPLPPAQARLRASVDGLRELRERLETRYPPGKPKLERPRLTLIKGGRDA
jgi:hypothetical protein